MVPMDDVRAGRSLPTVRLLDRTVLASVLLATLGLWATSTKVLVATSGGREQGAILSCTYFTGFGIVERQYVRAAGEAAISCPIVKTGQG
jgi:hypothetical protein